MVKYKEVKEEFEKQNCQLLLTEEEFGYSRSVISKFRYIASCGHEHEVWLNVFKNRGTGIKCPKCKHVENTKTAKEKLQNNKNMNLELEHKSIEYIKKILIDFDYYVTCEGCLADLAIKPKNEASDSWLMVQVKSTAKPSRDYGFKCNNRYTDCIIFCMCESDKRMWIMNGNEINVKDKIAIGLNKSKYSKNEVDVKSVNKQCSYYYDLLPKYFIKDINTPISNFAKIEQEFRQLRESHININFQYETLQGLCYDFKINNFKIQEKVGYNYKGKKSIVFTLNKNGGTINGKRVHVSYQKGDNDFYWLHSPDKDIFWIIPEKELLDRNYINELKQKSICFVPSTQSWYTEYQFEYNNIAIDKLRSMFSL